MHITVDGFFRRIMIISLPRFKDLKLLDILKEEKIRENNTRALYIQHQKNFS